MRKGLLLIAVAALAGLLAAPATGAGYGKGRFTGKTKPEFDNDDPKTPITIKVKGKRVRVVETVFTFDCAEGGKIIRETVSTPFTKVHPGPAGGGATFSGTVTSKEGDKVDVSFAFGLRQRSVSGTSDATLDVDGLPCFVNRSFKANKR
jgi:hypothetical protein